MQTVRDVTPPPLCVPCGQWHHKHRSSLISVDGHRQQHVRAGCAPSCRAVIHSLKEQLGYMLNFNNSNVGLWLEQRVRIVTSYLKVGNRLKWRETVLRLSRGAGCNVLHTTGPRSTGRPSTSHVQQRVHWKLRVAVQNVLALSISPRCPDTRWGIILRSTVRTSDISWFSLPLLLQNSYNNRNPALGVLWSWHRVASPSIEIPIHFCFLSGNFDLWSHPPMDHKETTHLVT